MLIDINILFFFVYQSINNVDNVTIEDVDIVQKMDSLWMKKNDFSFLVFARIIFVFFGVFHEKM